MSKIIRVISNELIEIRKYRCPNGVFNTDEYSPYEEMCVLCETIDPFLMFSENHQLKEQNEFLIKRENKLQQIEMMFKNRNVDLEELSKLVLEGNNE